MSDDPPGPPHEDFEARLRQAQAKQAKQVKRTGPEGGTGRPSAGTIDRLWVTTQRAAMIETGPPAANPSTPNSPAEKEDDPAPK